eukprot:932039-Amphidinium_carterae.1
MAARRLRCANRLAGHLFASSKSKRVQQSSKAANLNFQSLIIALEGGCAANAPMGLMTADAWDEL